MLQNETDFVCHSTCNFTWWYKYVTCRGFTCFFRSICVCVILQNICVTSGFGLYNGLVSLPVLLTYFGPDYKRSKREKSSSDIKSNQISLFNTSQSYITNHVPPINEEVDSNLKSDIIPS